MLIWIKARKLLLSIPFFELMKLFDLGKEGKFTLRVVDLSLCMKHACCAYIAKQCPRCSEKQRLEDSRFRHRAL